MKKKVFIIFLVLFYNVQMLVLPCSAREFSISAKSCILINAESLDILYAKNENEKRGIASTTKILTSLIALEYGEPYKKVIATNEAIRVEGTSIGLRAGDTITLKALVYGMLLESGNDAANVTAFAISGGIKEFADLMNKYAKKLGMKNSNFKNPSGLTEDGHYSTAFDMALLTSVAIKNPVFSKITSTESAVIDFGTPAISRRLSNHNRLLKEYDGVFGVKTGYTKASGRCLVSAARRSNTTLICVTLNAYDDWNDHEKLYDYGFSLYEEKAIEAKLSAIKIPVVCSNKKYVTVEESNKLICDVLKDENLVETEIFVEQFLYPPVKKGDIVGEITVKNSNGKKISSIPLISEIEATSLYKEIKGYSIFERIKNIFKK